MSNSSGSSQGASRGVAAAPSMSASAIVAKVASGSHVLKIDGYSHTVGLGVGKFITSRSFVIGGHRWCLRYYPDGHCSSSCDWISIALCLDPGEAGEVRARYKISLLDKEGHPVSDHVRESYLSSTFSAKQEPPDSYLWNFIRKSVLQNKRFLKDDAFSVRCDITVVTGIVTKYVVTEKEEDIWDGFFIDRRRPA
ncbi:hypothetical protein QYE76_045325 [Lolium multiflorum]|uniref:MATH domain-containing protein n=1 Tax=Lolium multiflorum TaxID=4521 RepID=A0AAD8TMI3_LOLMU|nr:hypothetical protein QYE76_045325 [Lolium multiflorum]